MLTPTDVHYIIGFLSLAAGPENVEIELGDFVYDQATRTERDVDITITTRDTDRLCTAFVGLEVKAHKRRLNSEHVEQLVQKLRDMPAITRRAIVSASGFTKPAMRKAEHHHVDLYELKDWDPATSYDYFKAETVPASRETYGWVGNMQVRINPGRDHTSEERLILSSDPEMYLEGSPESKYKLKNWVQDVSKLAAKEVASRAGAAPKEGRQQIPATVTVRLPCGSQIRQSRQKTVDVFQLPRFALAEFSSADLSSFPPSRRRYTSWELHSRSPAVQLATSAANSD